MPGVADNAASVGKIDASLALKLNQQLEARSERDQLVSKSILRDPNESWVSIQDRGDSLHGLLKNRPSRDRLQRLNVIKEDDVSPALIAARDKLKKAQDKDKLESFLTSRPEHGSLRDRRILVDPEQAQPAPLDERAKLERLFAGRPKRESLIEANILKDLSHTEIAAAANEAYVIVPGVVEPLSKSRITSVGVGWSCTIALDDQGNVYSFGSSDNGRLGQGREATTGGEPKRITGFGGARVAAISVGVNHNAAVTDDGKLYLWGEGQWGRLGLGDCEDRYDPTLLDLGEPVSAVSCGAYHTLVLTRSRRVFSFGWNKFGRLGVDMTKHLTSEKPLEITDLAARKVVQVSAGWVSSAAITEDGALYTWGCGTYGVLAHGDEENLWRPKMVAASFGGAAVKSVALGEYHMLCLNAKGDVYSCGRNDYHQLGNAGASVSVPVPVAIGEPVSHVACGKQYSMAVTASGRLLTWGRGSYGVLGQGDIQMKDVPTPVGPISQVARAAGGVAHSALCTSAGQLFTFGNRGANGQLGQ
ncbi:Regulator of chromosome condensation (RCC1) repeat [Plasmodiophora brassicae]|uniref:RCC1-like domain-containing protein n=1 Tax=Plasmodiophora brassicae TaxID=37360 RepID=A0A0G4J8C7_PLABS|nr:hypothetical protein PBRA_003364 [Plasmodiophora brassicae]SPQ99714.1 unnamed protein product [Plasmodiophora brassicae]